MEDPNAIASLRSAVAAKSFARFVSIDLPAMSSEATKPPDGSEDQHDNV